MSVLVGKDTKVLVQGFTGKNGTLHSEQSIAYGTNIVGGVTPGKGGTTHLDRPVFDTMNEAVKATGANASVIFVPAPFVLDSIVEAINSGVKLIVVITEGVPTLDMLKAKRYLENVNADLQAKGEEIIRMVQTVQASSAQVNAKSVSCQVTFTKKVKSVSSRVLVH
jgi:succinyl-CoA synthetase alpha subunit